MNYRHIAAVAASTLLFASQVCAFGTVSFLGQNREHERITRHALGCGQAGGPSACFEAFSLTELAGGSGTFGAVGAPDNPARGLLSSSEAHCDNGDYLDVAGYPRTKEVAWGFIMRCRDQMSFNMYMAVEDSAALLDQSGNILDPGVDASADCSFTGVKGRAKCNVIEDLGLLMHASEDFYSHSNWADQADASRPVGRDNPPGLGNTAPAPFLDMHHSTYDVTFPPGLITGCFVNLLVGSDQNGCPTRVPHEFLNKDKGTIDDASGNLALGAGTTQRGGVNNNFQNAVTVAIADTRLQWQTFQDLLSARYGAANAAKMVCAITHDDPTHTC
jgi:hypothetical protein